MKTSAERRALFVGIMSAALAAAPLGCKKPASSSPVEDISFTVECVDSKTHPTSLQATQNPSDPFPTSGEFSCARMSPPQTTLLQQIRGSVRRALPLPVFNLYNSTGIQLETRRDPVKLSCPGPYLQSNRLPDDHEQISCSNGSKVKME